MCIIYGRANSVGDDDDDDDDDGGERTKSDKCVGHKKQITKHINQILKTDFQQNVLIKHLKWSTPILTNALNLIEQKS